MVTIFRGYLRQTASYQVPGTLDEYGEPASTEPSTVACRVETALKLVKGSNGEMYESTIQYFLPFEPVESAKIDGREIIGIESNPDLHGVTQVWEAYC